MKYIYIILILFFSSEFSFSQSNDQNFINLSPKINDLQIDSKQKGTREIKPKKNIEDEKVKNISLKAKKGIQIGELKSPSIGSIGIETKLNTKFGLNLWDNFEAKEAIVNLNYLPNVVPSKFLQEYLVDLYSSVSLPPKGETKDIIKFLETKLLKISSSGYVKNLNEIVVQLPNNTRWERWKRWYVEYNLMKKNDDKACDLVNEFLKMDLDNFWQKAKIICLLTKQNFNEANFIHDVLESENLVDEFFADLFKKIVNDETPNKLNHKNVEIEPLHIVMLDILKHPIKANLIANFGAEYTDALIDLVYIDSEARSFLLDKLIGLKNVDREKIITIYQSVVSTDLEDKKALKNLYENSNGINRANVWLSALKMKDDLKKVGYILKVLDIENDLGRFSEALDLYMPILNSLDKKLLTDDFNNKIKFLNILNNPRKNIENDLSKMILLSKGSYWDIDLIEKNKAWELTNYLEKSGMKSPNINWFQLINNKKSEINFKLSPEIWTKNLSFNNFLLNKSIEQKVMNKEYAHSLLLMGRLFDDKFLKNFNMNNLYILEDSLRKMALEDLGKKIRIEILTSKFSQFRN